MKDIRINIVFWDHWKTLTLKAELGLEAVESLQRLWCFAAMNKPSGLLDGMSPKVIEMASRWSGEKGAWITMLEELRFVERVGDWYALHDWADHNGFAATADARSAQAKAAVNKRWGRGNTPSDTTSNTDGNTTSNTERTTDGTTERNTPSPYPYPSPYPLPTPYPSPTQSTESKPSSGPDKTAEIGSAEPASADVSDAASPAPAAEDRPALVGELLPAGQTSRAAQSPATSEQVACRATWAAYSDAYQQRYGTAPVRNAKTNAAIKSFTRRIGADESPGVARYYLQHADAFYARKGHDVGPMLADAEKLRMEWATQRQVTGVTARQQERTGTMRSTVERILAARGTGE